MTTLSILLPHYNDSSGLAISLQSVAEQTWEGSQEILVCDDGSSAHHLREAERIIAQSQLPVRLLRNGQNRGRPYTRNVLLDAVAGKFVAWLDAGDEWYPTKLQSQFNGYYRARLKGLEQPIWMTCNYHWKWTHGKPLPRRQKVTGDQAGSLLLGELSAYLWTILAPTEAMRSVGYFDLQLPRLQDLDFFLRFAEKGGLLMLPDTDEALCVYHKSDIGRRGDEVLRCYNYIFEKHSALMLARSRRFRRNRKQHMYMHAARFTSNNSDSAKTAFFLATAAAINPVRFVRVMNQSGWRL